MFLLLLNALASEFFQICKAVAIGFGVMGFIGYFVKLILICGIHHRIKMTTPTARTGISQVGRYKLNIDG
jgi:hypothetical protein